MPQRPQCLTSGCKVSLKAAFLLLFSLGVGLCCTACLAQTTAGYESHMSSIATQCMTQNGKAVTKHVRSMIEYYLEEHEQIVLKWRRFEERTKRLQKEAGRQTRKYNWWRRTISQMFVQTKFRQSGMMMCFADNSFEMSEFDTDYARQQQIVSYQNNDGHLGLNAHYQKDSEQGTTESVLTNRKGIPLGETVSTRRLNYCTEEAWYTLLMQAVSSSVNYNRASGRDIVRHQVTHALYRYSQSVPLAITIATPILQIVDNPEGFFSFPAVDGFGIVVNASQRFMFYDTDLNKNVTIVGAVATVIPLPKLNWEIHTVLRTSNFLSSATPDVVNYALRAVRFILGQTPEEQGVPKPLVVGVPFVQTTYADDDNTYVDKYAGVSKSVAEHMQARSAFAGISLHLADVNNGILLASTMDVAKTEHYLSPYPVSFNETAPTQPPTYPLLITTSCTSGNTVLGGELLHTLVNLKPGVLYEVNLLHEDVFIYKDEVFPNKTVLGADWSTLTVLPSAYAYQGISKSRTIAIYTSAAVLFVALLAVFVGLRYIMSPLQKASTSVVELAETGIESTGSSVSSGQHSQGSSVFTEVYGLQLAERTVTQRLKWCIASVPDAAASMLALDGFLNGEALSNPLLFEEEPVEADVVLGCKEDCLHKAEKLRRKHQLSSTSLTSQETVPFRKRQVSVLTIRINTLALSKVLSYEKITPNTVALNQLSLMADTVKRHAGVVHSCSEDTVNALYASNAAGIPHRANAVRCVVSLLTVSSESRHSGEGLLSNSTIGGHAGRCYVGHLGTPHIRFPAACGLVLQEARLLRELCPSRQCTTLLSDLLVRGVDCAFGIVLRAVDLVRFPLQTTAALVFDVLPFDADTMQGEGGVEPKYITLWNEIKATGAQGVEAALSAWTLNDQEAVHAGTVALVSRLRAKLPGESVATSIASLAPYRVASDMPMA